MNVIPKPSSRVHTVTSIVASLKESVEGRYRDIWVGGEVTNYCKASSGHMYFTLKDSGAQLKCALYRGVNIRMRFEPKNGMEVVARGRLTIYESKGECQLQIEELQPKGLGAADLALKQLKEKLLERGYFDRSRKKPLVRFPKRLALIASPTGAAVRDMIELLAQRWPMADVIFRPSRVQGEGAAADLVLGLRMVNHLHKTGRMAFDAVVLGRGGGSTEDLIAFNEATVADAIFASIVPVVSAVGHETDVTIADLVADHRAETPSAAVVTLTPNGPELLETLAASRDRLGEIMQRRTAQLRQRLNQIATRPAFRKPLERIQAREQRLSETGARMKRAIEAKIARSRDRLAAGAGVLETLSPLNVLHRGYSLTRIEDGGLVRDAATLAPGNRIVTRVSAGEIVSVVEEIRPPRSQG